MLYEKDKKRLDKALDKIEEGATLFRKQLGQAIRKPASKIVLAGGIVVIGLIVLFWRLLMGGESKK